MKKIFTAKRIRIALFSILFLFINCEKEPLKITKVDYCEFFDSKGVCINFLSDKNTYEIQMPKSYRMDTWDNFSNFLYFKSKKTPGFVLKFNRKFTHTEKKKIMETYKAYFEFKEISGRVEGVEFGDDWIGSFQYLGSMLKERQRSRKEEKAYPFLYTIFPANLKFSYASEYFSGQIEMEIDLKLNKTEE